jgi:hypothetical protein
LNWVKESDLSDSDMAVGRDCKLRNRPPERLVQVAIV